MTNIPTYDPKTTALLCIDFYNDFLSEGGKLWPWVKAMAEQNNLLDNLRTIVRKGLERTSGNYKVMVELFNMPADDYKRFLGFLRKYQCHMPFQQFRSAATSRDAGRQHPSPGRMAASA